MKSKNYFSKIVTALFLLFAINTQANNVQITGTSVSGNDITFTISWDNSWNANVAPANWDAVWVFVKYQDCNTRDWAHTNLSTVAGDHSTSSPLQVDAVADGKGVFIRRSSLGGGTVASTSVTLKMTGLGAGPYNFKVFGIEMVNVPQGAFDLGDATSASTFNSISVTASSETSGITAATLGGSGASIPAAYPVGYNSFYAMKYEISQEQYVEYLNSLTYTQQKAHTINDPIGAIGTYAFSNSSRSGIRISTPGNNAAIPAIYACDLTNTIENNIDDAQNVAAGFLNWSDLTAYLDWAALRPMTELEFEKVSRGTGNARLAGEYPWGTTEINYVLTSGMQNLSQPNEKFNAVLNGLCNVYINGNSIGAPVKVGFSASVTSGRISAAASFYGAMEMAGNLYEMLVNATVDGVLFNGSNGDGTLSATGNANQATWPSVTTASGAGYRGGAFDNWATFARTSDRGLISTAPVSRTNSSGGRGVR
jgi:formylglycine-generating enzyme required for sulfatase activity